MFSKKHIFLAIITFFIAFGTTFFIIKSNDHKECNVVTKKYQLSKGKDSIVIKHDCKEKFNF